MVWRSRSRWILGLVWIALTAAGCDGDGAESPTVQTTESVSSTQPTTTAATTAATTTMVPPSTTSTVPSATTLPVESHAAPEAGNPFPPWDSAAFVLEHGLADAPRSEKKPNYSVGVVEAFNSHDNRVEAELVLITDSVAVWYQVGLPVPLDALERAMETFEREIPRVEAIMGSYTREGLDKDPRVHIIHQTGLLGTGWTPSTSPLAWFPNGAVEREAIFIDVDKSTPGSGRYLDVLRHEMVHVIQQTVDPNEQIWLEEGLGEYGMIHAALEDVDYVDRAFPQSTDVRLDYIPVVDGSLDSRGIHYPKAYWFLEHMADSLGPDAITELAAHQSEGIDAIEQVAAAYGSSFRDLFSTWILANNWVDDATWSCPRTAVNVIPFEYEASMPQVSAAYLDLEGSGSITVAFDGDAAARVLPEDLEPESEDGSVWWSTSSGFGLATLTGTLDLEGVASPTLRFDSAHRTVGFEWGIVDVSTDGGATWEVQPLTHADSDIWGLNAYAGDSPEGEWLHESIDLSPYAGSVVQVRFAFRSEGNNQSYGWFLDGIEAPGLTADGWVPDGFVETAATTPQSWVAFLSSSRYGDREQQTVEAVPIDDAGEGVIRFEAYPRHSYTIVIGALSNEVMTDATYRLTITSDNPLGVGTPPRCPDA